MFYGGSAVCAQEILSPQCALILAHLKLGKSLTTLEAHRPPFNCCRLSERIRELQAEGIRIDHTPVKVGKKRVIAYTLSGALYPRIQEALQLEGRV